MTKDEADKIYVLYEEFDDTIFAVSERLHADPDAYFNATSAWGHRLKLLLCTLAGHEVRADQCGKAEHDFCQRCGQRAPRIPGYVWRGGKERWVYEQPKVKGTK